MPNRPSGEGPLPPCSSQVHPHQPQVLISGSFLPLGLCICSSHFTLTHILWLFSHSAHSHPSTQRLPLQTGFSGLATLFEIAVTPHTPMTLSHHSVFPSIPCVKVLVTQSCPTHCDPNDYSPPGSSVHGIL